MIFFLFMDKLTFVECEKKGERGTALLDIELYEMK